MTRTIPIDPDLIFEEETLNDDPNGRRPTLELPSVDAGVDSDDDVDEEDPITGQYRVASIHAARGGGDGRRRTHLSAEESFEGASPAPGLIPRDFIETAVRAGLARIAAEEALDLVLGDDPPSAAGSEAG